jgi:hypothetical protein
VSASRPAAGVPAGVRDGVVGCGARREAGGGRSLTGAAISAMNWLRRWKYLTGYAVLAPHRRHIKVVDLAPAIKLVQGRGQNDVADPAAVCPWRPSCPWLELVRAWLLRASIGPQASPRTVRCAAVSRRPGMAVKPRGTGGDRQIVERERYVESCRCSADNHLMGPRVGCALSVSRSSATATLLRRPVQNNGSGVRGLLVQKTGLSAREIGEVRRLQRSVFASADRLGEGDVVSAGEGDVLVPER